MMAKAKGSGVDSHIALTAFDHPSPLLCSDCGSRSFAAASLSGVGVYCCRECHGVFLPRGALQSLDPKLAGIAAPEAAAAAAGLALAADLLLFILGNMGP